MNAHRTEWNPHVVMWIAIGGSLVLLGVLLALGVGDTAWTLAAAVLLIACVLVCGVAALQSRQTDREVRAAINRLADQRRRDRRSGHPRSDLVS